MFSRIFQYHNKLNIAVFIQFKYIKSKEELLNIKNLDLINKI